ncbi:MAG: NAD(P)-dependent oxidoreductase [Paracoccaceae bacterium]
MDNFPVQLPVHWRQHRTRILVLGASGRLGCALSHRIRCTAGRSRSAHMIWQTRKSSFHFRSPSGESLVWDILNEDAPSGVKADIVLCLAGVVPGGRGCLSQNSDLARSALNFAHKIAARHVFLASSAAVYGAGPFGEDTIPKPINAYGRAKAKMERTAMLWRETAPVGAPGLTMMRIGNVAGADSVLGPGPRHVELVSGPNGEPIKRSFIGPSRLSDMLLDLAQMAAAGFALPQFLNVALSPSVSLRDVLDQAGWPYSERPTAGLRPIEVALQTQRLAQLGLCPDRNAGIADILNDLHGLGDVNDVA